MKEGNPQHVRKVSWKEIYPTVRSVNRELADELNKAIDSQKKYPQNNPTLFKASYSYGQLLVKQGQFLSPCNQCAACNQLSHEISSIPLTLILDKCVEVYLHFDAERRDIPLRLLNRGEPFGVFETIDGFLGSISKARWSVSAGAWSVEVIFPLEDTTLIRNANKAFNTSKNPQEDIRDFIRAAAENQGVQWSTDVLVFPDKWLHQVATSGLREKLFRIAWLQSANLREQVFDDLSTALMSVPAVRNEGASVSELHRYHTVRHLLAIAKGAAPAFQIASNEENQVGPFDAFRKSLINLDHKKKFFPLVLYASSLTQSKTAGYYSLKRPSMPYLTLQTTGNTKWIQGLQELIKTLDRVGAANPDFKISGWQYLSSGQAKVTEKAAKGSYPKITHPSIVKSEFIKEQENQGLELYTGHPFFIACVRVARQ